MAKRAKNWKLSLVPIDLSKATENECPGINENDYFLARIDGEFYFGQFSRQWYGWNFDDDWGCSGHQFDAPGSNRSGWQALWKLKISK